jgi:hypothetical protein
MGAPETLSKEQKKHYKTFFDTLPYLLPCSVCGDHMLANLKSEPIDNYLQGRESLFKWSVKFHNLVNTQTGKPQVMLDDAFQLWKKICMGDFDECGMATMDPRIKIAFIAFVVIVVLVIIIGIFFWKSCK